MGLVLVITSFLVTMLILPLIKEFLINAGAVRKNYLKQDIPIGLGLVLLFGSLPSFLLYCFSAQEEKIFLILLVLTLTLLVGFIDDLLGNHFVKGLKGHFLKLITGRELTSGAFKAIVVSTVSLFICIYYWENPTVVVLNFIILVLTTNTFNLLDVRPGRTIKSLSFNRWINPFILPENAFSLGLIIASVLAYAPFDLKGQGMLGDTGSNFLGMSIGLELILMYL